MVRLLLLTGQRRDEVAGMRWNELDLEKAVWSLPTSRTKNGRPHDVPLSDAAVKLLLPLYVEMAVTCFSAKRRSRSQVGRSPRYVWTDQFPY